MATITPDLVKKLQREPNATVNLIVRLVDSPEVHVADAQAKGLQVQRTFSLISAMAVRGTAAAALALMNESWVVSVEEDKSVHIM